MKCKKCGSTDVSVQAVTETKTKGKGWSYWLFWVWLDMVVWIFVFVPRLLVGLFKKKKIVTETRKMAICQSCGYSRRIR